MHSRADRWMHAVQRAPTAALLRPTFRAVERPFVVFSNPKDGSVSHAIITIYFWTLAQLTHVPQSISLNCEIAAYVTFCFCGFGQSLKNGAASACSRLQHYADSKRVSCRFVGIVEIVAIVVCVRRLPSVLRPSARRRLIRLLLPAAVRSNSFVMTNPNSASDENIAPARPARNSVPIGIVGQSSGRKKWRHSGLSIERLTGCDRVMYYVCRCA